MKNKRSPHIRNKQMIWIESRKSRFYLFIFSQHGSDGGSGGGGGSDGIDGGSFGSCGVVGDDSSGGGICEGNDAKLALDTLKIP